MILDEAGLEAWGHRIGAAVAPPVFVGLSGDLGAGKSVLARAIARGAGVEAIMPSPTFNLVFRYDGRAGVNVVHMDLYRLERPDEVWTLGWRELGEADEIVLVEWPERAGPLLPPDRWEIRLEHAGATLRRVSALAHGAVPELPPAGP
jgi:tRNA threonylcarbamoyladenosine biosynthesis protein TsaE